MEGLLNFLADNYKWFMIGAILLLIALVGFIVDGKKKKNKEVVPEGTTTLSQDSVAMQTQPETPVQPTTPPEPSLVFEQPSLTENETVNELNGVNTEPSLSFEPIVENESQPVDFSQPTNNINSENNIDIGTIGEPITAPDMTVQNVTAGTTITEMAPDVQENVNALNATTPVAETPTTQELVIEEPQPMATPVIDTPVVDTPVVDTPVVDTPVVETPVVEAPVAEVPPVQTPVVEPQPMEIPSIGGEEVQINVPPAQQPTDSTPIV